MGLFNLGAHISIAEALKAVLLVAVIGVAHRPALAEPLGRLGATYPVAEQDARKYLEDQVNRSLGSPRAMRDAARKSAESFLGNLPPVEGIRRVVRNRTRYVDLVHTFSRDVNDAKGKALVKAGTRIDLLKLSQLRGFLLLLDGRDSRQVMILERLWRAGQPVTAILVAGSHTQLSARLKRQLYYDYGGVVSARFGVTNVPALVGQEGNRIRIEEMKP